MSLSSPLPSALRSTCSRSRADRRPSSAGACGTRSLRTVVLESGARRAGSRCRPMEVPVSEKSPFEQLHDAVSAMVHGAVTDPVGTAGKAAQQARGVLSLGFLVVGQVAQTVAERLMQSPTPP